MQVSFIPCDGYFNSVEEVNASKDGVLIQPSAQPGIIPIHDTNTMEVSPMMTKWLWKSFPDLMYNPMTYKNWDLAAVTFRAGQQDI